MTSTSFYEQKTLKVGQRPPFYDAVFFLLIDGVASAFGLQSTQKDSTAKANKTPRKGRFNTATNRAECG